MHRPAQRVGENPGDLARAHGREVMRRVRDIPYADRDLDLRFEEPKGGLLRTTQRRGWVQR